MSSTRQRGIDPYDRFNDDPCRHKHGGTDTSNAAWEKARHGVAECQQIILDVLRHSHSYGMTCKEIAGVLGKAMHKISGRITELLESGLVRKSGEIRDGGKVIQLETLRDSSINSSQATRLRRTTIKAEIVRLVGEEDYWQAIRVAYDNSIAVRVEMAGLTV